MKPLRIVVDKDIPFLHGVLEPWASVEYIPGAKISAMDVARADALVVRTRTRCGQTLLDGSSVQLVVTATIGMDHIDLPWCKGHGIEVASAAGCNSGAVMQYVFTAIYAVRNMLYSTPPRGEGGNKGPIAFGNLRPDDGAMPKLGVIGVGNVGAKVANLGEELGFRVLRCDPPRAAAEGLDGFVSLDELLDEADVVTMHVPLDASTKGMADESFFAAMRDGAVFVNSSRGEVVDVDALLAAAPRLGPLVIDTWPGEPYIDHRLLDATTIATPHIAGYSMQGKLNATIAAVRAIGSYFGIEELKSFAPAGGPPVCLSFGGLGQEEIARSLLSLYPIWEDDAALRSNPSAFEILRSQYALRREFFYI